MEIKPIETVYNGYKFRSRLEARWAVFFDAAGIEYEYEPEGFESGDGMRYLPDFYLPKMDTYCEVKGVRDGAWDDIKRASSMIEWGGKIKRILILGNIPSNWDGGMWHFPCMYWSGESDCVDVGWWFFHDYDWDNQLVRGHISSAQYFRPFSIWDGEIHVFPQDRDVSFQCVSDTVLRKELRDRRLGYMNDYDAGLEKEQILAMNYELNRMTYKAFETARQSRFEYGENPSKS